jgi:hypothetical protein
MYQMQRTRYSKVDRSEPEELSPMSVRADQLDILMKGLIALVHEQPGIRLSECIWTCEPAFSPEQVRRAIAGLQAKGILTLTAVLGVKLDAELNLVPVDSSFLHDVLQAVERTDEETEDCEDDSSTA